MKFYQQEKIEKARKLRKRGFSFESIGQKLSVNEGTIRRWCLDIPCNNIAFTGPSKERDKIKKSEIGSIKNINIDEGSAKIFISLLYWAEGTKYPHSTCISFSNSDPEMVSTFVSLLRKAFHLDEKKFKIHLQLHSTHDQKEIFGYWSRLLQIPINQFWKPTITKPTRNMKRRNYKGTCTVRYHDYRILLKIMGIYEKFAEECAELARQRPAKSSPR